MQPYAKVEEVGAGRFAPVLKVRGEGRVFLGEYPTGEATLQLDVHFLVLRR
jgi:hypothetical protein